MSTQAITKPSQFGLALRSGYAWPGGYPLYFITGDGAALCHECGKTEGKRICDSIREQATDGWRVEAQVVNWEDPSLYCDHCGGRIESAYAEDLVNRDNAGM